jgi:hypothetical protein
MDSDKLKLLLNERDQMRISILEIEKTQHKIVFAVLTLAGVSLGALFTNYEIIKKDLLGPLIFFLSQTMYFLSIFNFQIWRNMAVKANYCKVIECEINNLFNQNIAIFESEIGPRYLYNFKSVAFWIAILFSFISVSTFLIIYFFLINSYNTQSDRIIFTLVFGLEMLAAIAIYVFSNIEDPRVYNDAKKLAGSEILEDNNSNNSPDDLLDSQQED